MAVLTESTRLGDLLYWEEDARLSREDVTVLSGQNLTIGTVVGRITVTVPTTGTAVQGNTGNGTVTDVTGGPMTLLGTYRLQCIAAATNGGTFAVFAPDGYRLPDAVVGSAYSSDHLNLTINDGSTDFAVGDSFTITVTEGSGKVKAINFSAVDGTQKAYGIVIDDYDATNGDVRGVAIVREAVVNKDKLVWPSGATPEQKAGALAQLAAKGVITRPAV